MTRYNYQAGREIDLQDWPFCALVMATMRAAVRKDDMENVARLRAAYPEVWDELQARDAAPDGLAAG